MMTDKTVEDLKRELHNAKASVSYHKNKNKTKRKKVKTESPAARAKRLQASQQWNDVRRASEIVVARATTNSEAEYNDALTAVKAMHIDELRELTKGHEAEVEAEVIVRQQERAAKAAVKETQEATLKTPTPIQPVPHRPSKSISSEGVKTVYAPKETYPAALNVSNLEKAQQIASRRLGFNITKEQTIDHVISRFLQNYS